MYGKVNFSKKKCWRWQWQFRLTGPSLNITIPPVSLYVTSMENPIPPTMKLSRIKLIAARNMNEANKWRWIVFLEQWSFLEQTQSNACKYVFMFYITGFIDGQKVTSEVYKIRFCFLCTLGRSASVICIVLTKSMG